MPGSSPRRGRRTTPKSGAPTGSGGKRRAGLQGKGPTPPAEQRPWHKAYSGTEPVPKRTAWKQEKERRTAEARGRRPKVGTPGTAPLAGPGGAGRPRGKDRDGPELLVGRNPVVEAVRAHVPATMLYIAHGIEVDERVTELVRTAADRGIPLQELSRTELDRRTGPVVHQGVALQVPPYAYLPFEDLLADAVKPAASLASLDRSDAVEPAASLASLDRSDALEHPAPPLLVALDGVTDPRNLGAVIRSAAAFGAHGLFLPRRRAAGVTAAAWRTSAGAAARLPVARVTNLTRSLQACQRVGLVVVGLDADADTPVSDLEAAVGPLVLVVGSESRGLSRLVGETCDLRVAIPVAAEVESLNASVAAAVALAEVSRKRGGPGRGRAADPVAGGS